MGLLACGPTTCKKKHWDCVQYELGSRQTWGNPDALTTSSQTSWGMGPSPSLDTPRIRGAGQARGHRHVHETASCRERNSGNEQLRVSGLLDTLAGILEEIPPRGLYRSSKRSQRTYGQRRLNWSLIWAAVTYIKPLKYQKPARKNCLFELMNKTEQNSITENSVFSIFAQLTQFYINLLFVSRMMEVWASFKT